MSSSGADFTASQLRGQYYHALKDLRMPTNDAERRAKLERLRAIVSQLDAVLVEYDRKVRLDKEKGP